MYIISRFRLYLVNNMGAHNTIGSRFKTELRCRKFGRKSNRRKTSTI